MDSESEDEARDGAVGQSVGLLFLSSSVATRYCRVSERVWW